MVKLTRKRFLLAKLETTYGTDPTPTGVANALEVSALSIKEYFPPVTRPVNIAGLTPRPSLSGQRYAEVTFTAEMFNVGALGTAPRMGALFKACDFAEVISAGSSVTYSMGSGIINSVTLYVFIDGLQHIVTGCVGDIKFMGAAGKQMLMNFTFKGLWAAPTDGANPSCTFETNVDKPPVVLGAGLTYNSSNLLVVKSLEIDLGNIIAMREDVSQTYAIKGFYITGKKPVVKLDCEADTIANIDWRTGLLSTQQALSMNVGGTSTNKVGVSMPKVNIFDVQYKDDQGITHTDISGELTDTVVNNNDALSLVYQ